MSATQDNAPSAPCCGNCQFGKVTNEMNKRLCCRFPPTPYVMGGQMGRMTQMNVWPAVQSIDICGEHRFRVVIEALRLEPTGAFSTIRRGDSLGPANPEARDG